MIKKGTRIYSITKMKCPKCHEGDFFVSHPYDLRRVGDIHEKCPVCELKFEREPGFFYGAMYVSYALGVALFVTLWVSMLLFLPSIETWAQIFIIISVSVVLTPYLYALSKIIWANFFFKYDRFNSAQRTDKREDRISVRSGVTE